MTTVRTRQVALELAGGVLTLDVDRAVTRIELAGLASKRVTRVELASNQVVIELAEQEVCAP